MFDSLVDLVGSYYLYYLGLFVRGHSFAFLFIFPKRTAFHFCVPFVLPREFNSIVSVLFHHIHVLCHFPCTKNKYTSSHSIELLDLT